MIEWIITSCVLIVIVALLRLVLKGRISLRLQYALWIIVLARLLIPVNFISSPMSVMNVVPESVPVAELQQPQIIDTPELAPSEQVDTPVSQVPILPVNPMPITPDTPEVQEPVELPEPQQQIEVPAPEKEFSYVLLLQIIWVSGIAITAIIFLFANICFALRLKRTRQTENIDCRLKVYRTAIIDTPCLCGLFRPAIYLTEEAGEDVGRQHILTHELTHYKHWDHIWGFFRCLCLAVHWYNPLVWIAAILSRRDSELACDESVIKQLGEEHRAEYGKTLIRMTCTKQAVGSIFTTATTMTGSKKTLTQRIKLIAKHPKTALYAAVCLVLVAAIAVGCTFTGAKIKNESVPPIESTPIETEQDVTEILEENTEESKGIEGTDDTTSSLSELLIQKKYQPVEPVGEVPKEFELVISENRLYDAVAFKDRLLRSRITEANERIYTQLIEMMDLYGNGLASYSFVADRAYRVSALLATEDGGFLVVLSFEDYTYAPNAWASDDGYGSRVLKCDKNGKLQFDITFNLIDDLKFSFERNGLFYIFGQFETPETNVRGVYSPGDIYMAILNQSGTVLKTKIIAGSDFDSLENAEPCEDGYILSISAQSNDGDFEGSNSGGYPVDWIVIINNDLEIIQKQKKTGRDCFDKRLGEKDSVPVYSSDPVFNKFTAGTPETYIAYADYYMIVSLNITGIYENPPPCISSRWYYYETVYSAYDYNGNLLFRNAVDSSPDYDSMILSFTDS